MVKGTRWADVSNILEYEMVNIRSDWFEVTERLAAAVSKKASQYAQLFVLKITFCSATVSHEQESEAGVDSESKKNFIISFL